MEESIKSLLDHAQLQSDLHGGRADFCKEVQRVIKEQADEIAKLKADAESNIGDTCPSTFTKAFLLGAGYGANYQTSYVQDEVRDYETDVYTSLSDGGMYADIQGTFTLDASDLIDHLRFRSMNLSDLEDIRAFLDMKDEEIMDNLARIGIGPRQLPINLDKSTDNETQQNES